MEDRRQGIGIMHQTDDPTLESGWRWFWRRFVMLAQCMTCIGPWRAPALKLATALKFNGAGEGEG